jgi:Fe-S cluster biogenesis protein NfuA
MFIQTETTPNPNTLKFIFDEVIIMENGSTIEFKNKEQAELKSPLALELFKIGSVTGVFFGHDFITITKAEESKWQEIKTEILATIMDFLVQNQKILNEFKEEKTENKEDNEIVKQIKELIEIKVRPAVAMDGGDIIYRDFVDGVVYLELKGSCSGCPSSTITLKNGIENMLKHYIPEVTGVEQIFDD